MRAFAYTITLKVLAGNTSLLCAHALRHSSFPTLRCVVKYLRNLFHYAPNYNVAAVGAIKLLRAQMATPSNVLVLLHSPLVGGSVAKAFFSVQYEHEFVVVAGSFFSSLDQFFHFMIITLFMARLCVLHLFLHTQFLSTFIRFISFATTTNNSNQHFFVFKHTLLRPLNVCYSTIINKNSLNVLFETLLITTIGLYGCLC